MIVKFIDHGLCGLQGPAHRSPRRLKALPDLSRCPKLRVLIVDDCGLVSVHRSFTPANHPKLERLVVSGNPGLEGRERAKIDAFAATTTANGGWVRG